jgi:hypothetical protein
VVWGTSTSDDIGAAGSDRGRMAIAVAVLFVLATLVSASPARAAFPGRPGRIAFDSRGAIWTIAAGHRGGGVARLATGVDPAFSPDGRLIAFVKGNRNLMVMRSDGSSARTVLSSHSLSDPSFSADGRSIFFTRDTSGEGYADIYSVRLSGGSARRLTHTGSASSEIDSNSPQASANGRYLVFQRNESVWTMRPDGSHQKRLAPGVGPSVSPNSRQVVFSRGEKLVIVGAGGGHERALHPFHFKKQPEELIRATASPTFSPDGRSVAFTFKRTTSYGPGLNDSKRLAVFSLASAKLQMITKPALGGSHADWQPLR